MCTNPKFLSRKGAYIEDNWHGKKGDKYEIEAWVKCGYCSQCVAEKSNNWVIRNYYESKTHEKKCFISLTYAKNPYFLVKKDLQDFMKRLRRYLEYRKLGKVRCFYAGEYGSRFNRPHFHIILYGWEDKNTIYRGLSKKGYPIFYSKIIEDIWGLGRTSYQSFNDHEIPYISLYDTEKENASFTYRMKKKIAKKRIKKILEIIHEIKNQKLIASYFNQIKTLEEEIKNEKSKYITIKEFNGWSLALGWQKFFENYSKEYNYSFKEFIENCEYATPTPWVKKLANYGFADARKEMLVRADELNSKLKENPKIQNKLHELAGHREEIIKQATEYTASDLD